jgi:hypothetical protein
MRHLLKRLFFSLAILTGFTFSSCIHYGASKYTNNELIREIERLSLKNAELKAHTERLTPITWEIANGAGESKLGELAYYLSAPLKLLENIPRSYNIRDNGILVVNETNDKIYSEIQSTVRGEFNKYTSYPQGKESFMISFPGEKRDVMLNFERETATDCFVLVGVVDNNSSISIDGAYPYLCVFLDYKDSINPMYRNISSAARETTDPQPTPTEPVTPKPTEPVTPKPTEPVTPNPTEPVTPKPTEPVPPRPTGSRYIIADGVLSSDSIVSYIQSKNFGVLTPDRIATIVNTYIGEARKEGVNHDIAIAQMCEGTNYLTNRDRLYTYNYGDLHNIKRPKEKATFQSMEIGIKVHIQQLKYYASPTGLRYPPVDQARLKRVEKNRGKYRTLDQLFPVWVTKNLGVYRNTINNILIEMYNFQR